MTSPTRAQRLVDEFEEGAHFGEGYDVRAGIAAVLTHLVATEAELRPGAWYAVPINVLENMAEALTAPSLEERALAGDAAAARQFLHEAGFTDERGQLLPQYQPEVQP